MAIRILKKMSFTCAILTFALLFLISCKHVETTLETHNRNAKSSIESIICKVDSLTGVRGIQKTLFLIDTHDIKYKHLIRLDRNTMNLISNGIMIKENDFENAIDTTYSAFYFFDTLTCVFNKPAYLIIQKQHSIFESIRLLLVQVHNEKATIKLLAAEQSNNCMLTITMSALLGDSIIYTQEIADAVSDVIDSKGMYYVKTEIIKKYRIKDNSYFTLDSLRTNGFR
jgi:hypothetical protein